MKKLLGKLANENVNDLNFFKRLISYAIDWYLGGVVASLPIIIVYMIRNNEVAIVPMNLNAFANPDNLIAGGMSFMVAICYYALVPAYVWPGQTIGKKIVNLKIVASDYGNVSVKQIFVRQILAILIVEGSVYGASNTFHQLISIMLKVNITGIYGCIGLGITILSVVLTLIFKSKRAFHDLMAGTMIVDLKAVSYKNRQKKIERATKRQLRYSKG